MISKKTINKILSLIIFLCLLGCAKEDTETIDFKDTLDLTREKQPQELSINICVGSMITPQQGYIFYKKLLDYIAKKTDMNVNFIEKITYAEVNALLENEKIDLAFVCGGPYVEGKNKFGLELLAAPQIDGKSVYYSYIIVSQKSNIQEFPDLKGKTFAFVDPMSNTGKLAPTYFLLKSGLTLEDFFKEYFFTYGHDDSIKAVSQGIVDAAAVDSLIWDYLYKKNDLDTLNTKIIQRLGPFGIPPVVVRPNLDTDLKNKLKDILLNMHKDQEGQEILKAMLIERFVNIEDQAYDSIREMMTSLTE